MPAAEGVAHTAPTTALPQLIELPNARFTYFIMLPDDYEKKIMLAYLESKYAKESLALAKKVGEMRVDRLTDMHTVIALVRPRPSPAATPFKNQMGLTDYEHHEPELKGREVRESRPILIKRFWRAASDEAMVDGELNTSEFLTALAQAASPLSINWHPEQTPGVVKLSWV